MHQWERPEMDDAAWDALRARQLEWQRVNPEPKHTPGEVCDCPMPWREERGDGHCAVCGDIVTGAQLAKRRAAKDAGIVVYQIPQEWVWYATIEAVRMPGEFATAEAAMDAALLVESQA